MTGTLQVHPALLNLADEGLTPPGSPVTLADAKAYLRVDGDDQDSVITAMIAGATNWAEGFTRRAFLERPLDARYADAPPPGCRLVLALPPVTTLTAITYEDSDGAAQTLNVGDFELDPLYGFVSPAPGSPDWPAGVRFLNVRYTAGYGPDAADVPAGIHSGILVSVGQMFEYRVNQTVGSQISPAHSMAAKSLLSDFKVFEL